MSYRSKSAERVLSEFRTLSEAHGLKQFEVVDNILDMKHIRTVLPSLYGLGYKIFYETKANLKRSQLEVLSQAGVCWIQPGIESLHDAVLELMDKGNSAVMNVELLKNCKELGIRVDWSILCGFPGEKDEYYREMASWLPALYHLEAPIGLFCIRYDRFSPYHTNPEGYGVKLKPYWTYSHCYPLEAAELNELAYFFEDDGPGPPGRYVAQEEARVRPGLATLRQRVLEWQKCGPEVGLRMEDQDGELRVFDTRPTAGNQQYSLLGLEASICRACRGLKSRSALLTAVEELEQRAVSDGEMNQALQKVMDLALVLELGERFVGLAQMGGIRPPQVHFPGGSVSL